MPRKSARRAASKVATKQMQLLSESAYDDIDNEDESMDPTETFDIPSEDEQAETDAPPKKKYRLSNRKSGDGQVVADRDVLVLKSVNMEELLSLDAWIEDLSEVQKAARAKVEQEYKELNMKIEQVTKSAEVIFQGEVHSAFELNNIIPPLINSTPDPKKKSNPPKAKVSTTPKQSLVMQTNKSNAAANSYQLVMDPRLGLIVGTMTPTTPSSPALPTQSQPTKSPVPAPARQTRQRGKSSVNTPPLTQGTPPPKAAKVSLPPAASLSSSVRPAESTSVGGISKGPQSKSVSGKSSTVVDLTSEEGSSRTTADSKEIAFNKLQGKTFPSLVVVARPHLSVKDISGGDRTKLDAKVKSILLYVPTKFTEWLIQQGLVRSEQVCINHSNTKLKLGMYSDVSKFPYSGGYVWISECCPSRFVSVFSGSLFEGSSHPPTVILKLIYHWACQTNIQNIVQWVKVDNLYVKGINTFLRSICTAALHTHVPPLGGPGRKVEVGVISLGTTTQDGMQRQVKVEVLGILESEPKHVRLRAIEPIPEADKNYKKRFAKILEPLHSWVHKDSLIVTDLTVDKQTLFSMGFTNVQQSTSSGTQSGNQTIMEYLRRIVPRMFQNTLSLLSREIIQQFLDELVWREWYGTTAAQCFDNALLHIAEQTRADLGESLIIRLNKVASAPFASWSFKTLPQKSTNNKPPSQQVVEQPDSSLKKGIIRQKKTISINAENSSPDRAPRTISPDVPEQLVPLENYYYGTIDTYDMDTAKKVSWSMKCSMCKFHFSNNIKLMGHLFTHAHNVSGIVHQCQYCLSSVGSQEGLTKHIATSHPVETKFMDGFVCIICEQRFANTFSLGKHLSKEHVPAELPYHCGTCSFKCSSHRQAIEHFYNRHDTGTTIQCPFCLKSTTIVSSGRILVQNLNFFLQHLQKHQKKALARKCPKCALWFINKDNLKEHQMNMHSSQRRKCGLIPWAAPRNGIMVPKSKTDKQVWEDSDREVDVSSISINVPNKLSCKECKSAIKSSGHFQSLDGCLNQNCQYETCCKSAMENHTKICKDLNASLPIFNLNKTMFCVCGYSDNDGNTLAKHLAQCERKSAYPSAEVAKNAIKTHSMLDVLGLVRRPEEPSKPSPPVVDIIELEDEKDSSEKTKEIDQAKEDVSQEKKDTDKGKKDVDQKKKDVDQKKKDADQKKKDVDQKKKDADQKKKDVDQKNKDVDQKKKDVDQKKKEVYQKMKDIHSETKDADLEKKDADPEKKNADQEKIVESKEDDVIVIEEKEDKATKKTSKRKRKTDEVVEVVEKRRRGSLRNVLKTRSQQSIVVENDSQSEASSNTNDSADVQIIEVENDSQPEVSSKMDDSEVQIIETNTENMADKVDESEIMETENINDNEDKSLQNEDTIVDLLVTNIHSISEANAVEADTIVDITAEIETIDEDISQEDVDMEANVTVIENSDSTPIENQEHAETCVAIDEAQTNDIVESELKESDIDHDKITIVDAERDTQTDENQQLNNAVTELPSIVHLETAIEQINMEQLQDNEEVEADKDGLASQHDELECQKEGILNETQEVDQSNEDEEIKTNKTKPSENPESVKDHVETITIQDEDSSEEKNTESEVGEMEQTDSPEQKFDNAVSENSLEEVEPTSVDTVESLQEDYLDRNTEQDTTKQQNELEFVESTEQSCESELLAHKEINQIEVEPEELSSEKMDQTEGANKDDQENLNREPSPTENELEQQGLNSISDAEQESPGVEEINEIDDADEINEIEDACESNEIEAAQATNEIAGAQEIVDVDEIEDAHEIEDAQATNEIAGAREIVDVDEIADAQEIEDAQATNEIAGSQEIVDVDEIADAHEIEDAQATNEIADAREIVDVDEIEDAREINEIEDAQATNEIAGAQEIVDVDEIEDAREINDAHEINDIEDADEINEMDDDIDINDINEAAVYNEDMDPHELLEFAHIYQPDHEPQLGCIIQEEPEQGETTEASDTDEEDDLPTADVVDSESIQSDLDEISLNMEVGPEFGALQQDFQDIDQQSDEVHSISDEEAEEPMADAIERESELIDQQVLSISDDEEQMADVILQDSEIIDQQSHDMVNQNTEQKEDDTVKPTIASNDDDVEPILEKTIEYWKGTDPISETLDETGAADEIHPQILNTSLTLETSPSSESGAIEYDTAPTGYTSPTSDKTSLLDEIMPIQEESTVVLDETIPVVEETTPILEETTPIPEEINPLLEDTTLILDGTTEVEEITPVEEETTSPVEEATLVAVDTTTIVEDARAGEENTPKVEEKVPILDETSLLLEETYQIQNETDPLHENDIAATSIEQQNLQIQEHSQPDDEPMLDTSNIQDNEDIDKTVSSHLSESNAEAINECSEIIDSTMDDVEENIENIQREILSYPSKQVDVIDKDSMDVDLPDIFEELGQSNVDSSAGRDSTAFDTTAMVVDNPCFDSAIADLEPSDSNTKMLEEIIESIQTDSI